MDIRASQYNMSNKELWGIAMLEHNAKVQSRLRCG